MPSTTLDIGPWIISGIALAQVWVIALVKSLRRPKLEIYESHRLEVGYSSLGPSLSFVLALRARRGPVFIRALQLKLVRKRDNLTRSFAWKFFKSFRFNPQTPSASATEAELARGLVVTPEAPRSAFPVFVDDSVAVELKEKADSLATRWSQFERDHPQKPSMTGAAGNWREHVFGMFMENQGGLEVYAALERSFYWLHGDYVVELQLVEDNGKTRALKRFAFAISEAEEKTLRLNAYPIQRSICNVPAEFFFVYPTYQAADRDQKGLVAR